MVWTQEHPAPPMAPVFWSTAAMEKVASNGEALRRTEMVLMAMVEIFMVRVRAGVVFCLFDVRCFEL